ncbi:hypothetical protein AB4Z50_20515 [Paenibacillus sp. 2TAB26]|uniref:hypothetical protein n=1 Tax=Paenibacillus sp. 2TAB26 TaxID=3233005 RepID=UPI003F953D23
MLISEFEQVISFQREAVSARMMADEQELREIKESLDKLDQQVKRLVAKPRRKRSGWMNFVIGFLIVLVGIGMSVGIFEFLKMMNNQ